MRIQDMKIAPHLFVGLGGCGSQIVNEIARKLKRRGQEYDRYRNLVHFFAFDTDIAELKKCDKVDHWVPISQFDKRQFVEHAYGQRGASEDELFTSWWPEHYQPRATSGAGAGQIRIESRLSVYRTLKAMPQYLTALRNCVRRAYDAGERFRDTHKQPMVHIYASLAGGTGSGSFLSVAYLMRDLVKDHQNPIVVGTFVLPAVFRGMGLPSQQLDKIMANGYAALMELEHLQSAVDTPSGRVRFQYDPNAKEPTFVLHGPFNQVYLVDDVGKLAAVMSDPREIYPQLADAAYTQIFSDIIERDRSTADNDEREIAVSDEQRYTKRYGSFGLSALVLPDEDILDYCAARYAAEAIARAFAIADAGASCVDEGASAVTPEQREQQFVRELVSRGRLPGDLGRFFRQTVDWVEGSEEAGAGALAELARKVDAQLGRLDEPLALLPRITEDWLLEFDEDPDGVRMQLAKRLEAWRAGVSKAREQILAEARLIASEVAGSEHDHSVGKATDGVGTLRVRLLLIRLEELLRGRQAAADAALREAQGRLAGWEERFQKGATALEEAAPKTLLERFTGNDYLQEVPTFVEWYRDSMVKPQSAALRADGELELLDALLEAIGERRARLAALFDQLGDIRAELLERAATLLVHGVAREAGGMATEHVLDVEVYQDHLDPEHDRLWDVVYRHRVRPEHFDPEEIARAIQTAEAGAETRRHVRGAVVEGLTALGRDRLGLAVTGDPDARTLDEMGLHIRAGLDEEARISWAWRRLSGRYGALAEVPDDEWATARADVPQAKVDEYVRDKLAFAARKCAPFWRITEAATQIEPKRYITVYADYLGDDWLHRMLTTVDGFQVTEGNLLRTGDPKRIVFYWNEMGAPVYRVASIDEYGSRYEFVKMDELRRGPIYRVADLRYRSERPEWKGRAAGNEGRRCPDIPLHTDRDWEGAPLPGRCLFDITMRAVQEGKAKIAWEEAQSRRAAAAAEEEQAEGETRAFALCRALGLIRRAEEGYLWALEELEREEDRRLGRFLDEARAGFGSARPAVRAFADRRLEARLAEVASTRNKEKVEALLRPHLDALEVALLNAGEREAAVIRDEMAVLGEELRRLLERC